MQHVGDVKLSPPWSQVQRLGHLPLLRNTIYLEVRYKQLVKRRSSCITASCFKHILKNTVPEITTCRPTLWLTSWFLFLSFTQYNVQDWSLACIEWERGVGGREADQNTHLQPSKCWHYITISFVSNEWGERAAGQRRKPHATQHNNHKRALLHTPG